jgi:DNA-binding transcriptional ArsR family regulator
MEINPEFTLDITPMLRQLWSDPRLLVILLTLTRSPGPQTASQLSADLDASPDTVTEKLHSLAAMGMVIRPRVRGGWYLTAYGTLFLLGADTMLSSASDSSPDPADLPDLIPFLDAICPELPSPVQGEGPGVRVSAPLNASVSSDSPLQSLSPNPSPLPHSTDFPGNPLPPSPSPLPHSTEIPQNPIFPSDSPLKKEKKESLIKEIKDSFLLKESSPEIQLSMADLLSKSHLLFGSPGVIATKLPDRPPQLVLGWLAQAYAQRRALRAPAVLVYKRLQHGGKPMPAYLDHPEKYLPASYLEAIGLVTYAPVDPADPTDPGQDEDLPSPFQGEGSGMRVDADPTEDEDLEESFIPDPSLLTVINNRTILASWDHALKLLQLDIRRDTYQTYLEPTRPVRWISPGILVIAAPTPYLRDWLTSRLTATLSRLLCGILNQPVSLLFECIQ